MIIIVDTQRQIPPKST